MSAIVYVSHAQTLTLAVHAAIRAASTGLGGRPYSSFVRLQSYFSGPHSKPPGPRHVLALLQLVRTGLTDVLPASPPRRSRSQQAHTRSSN